MDKNDQNPQLKEVENEISVQQDHPPKGKRLHHTWIFWIGLLLILIAIIYYIMTVNLAFAP